MQSGDIILLLPICTNRLSFFNIPSFLFIYESIINFLAVSINKIFFMSNNEFDSPEYGLVHFLNSLLLNIFILYLLSHNSGSYKLTEAITLCKLTQNTDISMSQKAPPLMGLVDAITILLSSDSHMLIKLGIILEYNITSCSIFIK